MGGQACIHVLKRGFYFAEHVIALHSKKNLPTTLTFSLTHAPRVCVVGKFFLLCETITENTLYL